MTLQLASHPEVDGWDVDVIAEESPCRQHVLAIRKKGLGFRVWGTLSPKPKPAKFEVSSCPHFGAGKGEQRLAA